MSSRRGLLSANRRPQASRRGADDEAALELPPYEQPSCPLTADGHAKLRELSGNRMNDRFQKHAKESAKLLANSVWAINDRAVARKKEASNAAEREAKRRRVNSNHDDGDTPDPAAAGAGADVESTRDKAAQLEEQVVPLTTRMEAAMREVLDLQAAVQDDEVVLRGLPAAVVVAQQELMEAALQGIDVADDEDPPEVPGVPLPQVLEKGCRAKAAAYKALSAHQRYARDNAYIDFKRNWHDGLYGDEVAVPDARTWFDREGNPQDVAAAGGNEDDSDADVRIAREKRSFRCPLSLVALTEPYTCRRCKHTFQKEAVYSYLGVTQRNPGGGEQKCPETGCRITVCTCISLVKQGVRMGAGGMMLTLFPPGHEEGRPILRRAAAAQDQSRRSGRKCGGRALLRSGRGGRRRRAGRGGRRRRRWQ